MSGSRTPLLVHRKAEGLGISQSAVVAAPPSRATRQTQGRLRVLVADDEVVARSMTKRMLELGADDYIIKPYEPAVLLARVNAVFNRLGMKAA